MPAKKPDTDETPPDTTPPVAEVAAPEPETVADEQPAVLPPGRYRFTYRDTTNYGAHGVTAEPDSLHDWPDGPPNDGRWTPASEGE